MKIEEIALLFNTYYKQNGIEVPSKVTDLFLSGKYPKGYGRTKLREAYGFTGSELLSALDATYVNYLSIDVLEAQLQDNLASRGLEYISKDVSSGYKLGNVTYKHTRCGKISNTSIASLRLTKFGCSYCTNNAQVTKEYVTSIVCTKSNSSLQDLSVKFTTLFKAKRDKAEITLKCLKCASIYTRNLGFAYHQGTRCPSCFPCKVYPEHYNGITFNSKFEKDCYVILQEAGLNIKTHVRYKDLIHTCLRRWSIDFVIEYVGKIFYLEVTSYQPRLIDGSEIQKHTDNLNEKVSFAKEQGIRIDVVRSLSELKTYIDSIKI